VLQRCAECGAPKEEYSDEEIGLCIVVLATYIHREPALAAPLLPEILTKVARLINDYLLPLSQTSNFNLFR